MTMRAAHKETGARPGGGSFVDEKCDRVEKMGDNQVRPAVTVGIETRHGASQVIPAKVLSQFGTIQ